jgi:hypothetical protein
MPSVAVPQFELPMTAAAVGGERYTVFIANVLNRSYRFGLAFAASACLLCDYKAKRQNSQIVRRKHTR